MLDAQIVKKRASFVVDVRVAVGVGETCALFGASGAGKSTILACIAGTERPDSGQIVLGETTLFPPALPVHRRVLGYLTQDANLFPHVDVASNVRFGLPRTDRAAHEPWISELRERLGLAPIWNAAAARISGGQARRVAFARMLARKPPLLLLDEPFTGLDRAVIRDMIAAIGEWQRRLGFSLIVVDHDAGILSRLCRRVIAIESGRIVQDGEWGEMRARPATPSLAQLLAPL